MRFPRRLAFGTLSLFAPLALLAVTPPASAMQPPLPFDPTWGDGGVAAPFIPGRIENVNSMAVHPDGGIVTALAASGLAPDDFVVVKLAADGSMDTSFGDDGMLSTGISSTSIDRANAVAVQPDGRILVAGSTHPGTGFSRFAIVRLLADGRLDTSFSGDGKTITSFGGISSAVPTSITLRPDGRILVSGGASSMLAASYRPDGVLDRTFDGDGRLAIPIPGDEPAIRDSALDADGNLVATGYLSLDDTSWDTLTVRVRPDGTLDSAYGIGGMTFDDFGFGEDAAEAVAIQPDGRIVVAGWTAYDGSGAATLSRYTPDGVLDPSFGVGGRVVTDVDHNGGDATGVEVLPDGRIALAGTTDHGPNDATAFVAVVDADGALDASFDGVDGVITTDLAPDAVGNRVGAAALGANGRLFVAGTYSPQPHRGDHLSVVRFDTTTPVADLSLGLAPAPAVRGRPLELSGTVHNDGPATATDVRLTVHTDRPFVSMRTDQGTCDVAHRGAPAVCSFGDVAPGTAITLSLGLDLAGSQGATTVTADLTSLTWDADRDGNRVTLEIGTGS